MPLSTTRVGGRRLLKSKSRPRSSSTSNRAVVSLTSKI